MNRSEKLESEHRAYLCLGSNIAPAANLVRAVDLLRQQTTIIALSTCWETEAVVKGENQTAVQWPNFLNLGAYLRSPLNAETLKTQVLRAIEDQLGRVRSADKYAPRTIDLDITIFDDQVLDAEIWNRLYLALIFAEMRPDLHNPETGETIAEAAQRLAQTSSAIPHPELVFL